MTDRPCTLCGKAAPEAEFGMRMRNGESVQRSWCRECERESNRIAMRKNRVQDRKRAQAAEARVERLVSELAEALLDWQKRRKKRRTSA